MTCLNESRMEPATLKQRQNISQEVMISNVISLDQFRLNSVFTSYWVPDTFNLVPPLSCVRTKQKTKKHHKTGSEKEEYTPS